MSFDGACIYSFGKDDGLGRCYNYAPGASNSGWSIEIIHSGGDAWIGEYVAFLKTVTFSLHYHLQSLGSKMFKNIVF